jgi:hypothetical protein
VGLVSSATVARALGNRLVQAVVAAGMADTAEIVRPTLVSDGMGGQAESEVVVATVPCAVGPMQAAPVEQAWAEQVQARAVYAIVVPLGTVAEPRDRLVVNGTMVYEVVTMVHRTWRVAERVICVRMEE